MSRKRGTSPISDGPYQARATDQHFARTPLHEPRLPKRVIGLRWLVFRANTRAEFYARADLLSRGIECYVPVQTTWAERNRRKFRRHAPLFPGYGFLGLGHAQSLADVRGVDGLESILRERATLGPLVVSAGDIEKLRHREEVGIFDETREAPSAAFAPGSAVVIQDDRFAGWVGQVERASSWDRLRVMLGALGAVDIDVAQLRRA